MEAESFTTPAPAPTPMSNGVVAPAPTAPTVGNDQPAPIVMPAIPANVPMPSPVPSSTNVVPAIPFPSMVAAPPVVRRDDDLMKPPTTEHRGLDLPKKRGRRPAEPTAEPLPLQPPVKRARGRYIIPSIY